MQGVGRWAVIFWTGPKSSGRLARSDAMITHRAVTGSLLSSGMLPPFGDRGESLGIWVLGVGGSEDHTCHCILSKSAVGTRNVSGTSMGIRTGTPAGRS